MAGILLFCLSTDMSDLDERIVRRRLRELASFFFAWNFLRQ